MATPVFCCGFECGQLGFIGQHWSISSGAPTISTSTVRTGTRSIRFNPTASVHTIAPTTDITITNKAVIRFYLRFTTLPGSDQILLRLNTTTVNAGIFFKNSDSKLYTLSYNGATASAESASGVAVTTGQWYRIDYYLDATTNPRTQKLSVDGTEVTSTNANASSNFSIAVGNTQSGTFDAFVDDFILSQTLADYPIGAGSVKHFVPTSDGTHNTGTAGTFITGSAGANITNVTTTSFSLVDEVPLDDTTPDTNDYINQAANGSTNYVEHVFGPASGISTPTSAPRAVEVIVAYHQAATGTGVSTFKLNDNGTENTIVALTGAGVTTTTYSRKHYATAPTGGAWTISGAGNFNNLRHRFGYSSDANPDQYFDCVMVEAEFSSVVAATLAATAASYALSGVAATLALLRVFFAQKPIIFSQAINRSSNF